VLLRSRPDAEALKSFDAIERGEGAGGGGAGAVKIAHPPSLPVTLSRRGADVARTFSATGTFDTQTQRDRLRRLLAAYALHDPEVGYVQVSSLAPQRLRHHATQRPLPHPCTHVVSP
jgi:hypothetical protein